MDPNREIQLISLSVDLKGFYLTIEQLPILSKNVPRVQIVLEQSRVEELTRYSLRLGIVVN